MNGEGFAVGPAIEQSAVAANAGRILKCERASAGKGNVPVDERSVKLPVAFTRMQPVLVIVPASVVVVALLAMNDAAVGHTVERGRTDVANDTAARRLSVCLR